MAIVILLFFFKLFLNSNFCLLFVRSTNARSLYSTCLNVLLCGHYGATKAQKRMPRALSFHTLYSLILLFLGVAKCECKVCVASYFPTLHALNRISCFVMT